MRSGRLRHQVVLQKQQTAQNGFGEKQSAWAAVATVWAAVETINGGDKYTADQHYHQRQTRIIIRHRDDVQAGWRVIHAGQCFAIQSIDDNGGLHRELHLTGEWTKEVSHED